MHINTKIQMIDSENSIIYIFSNRLTLNK